MADDKEIKQRPRISRTKELANFRHMASSIGNDDVSTNIRNNALAAYADIVANKKSTSAISYEVIKNMQPNDPRWTMVSKMYFSNPSYQRLILYYATLFMYYYYVSPTDLESTRVNKKRLDKEYREVLKFLDDEINVEMLTPQIMIDVLVEGKTFYYYDFIKTSQGAALELVKLPSSACEIVGYGKNGQLPIIQVSIKFLDDLVRDFTKKKLFTEDEVLKLYPKELQKAYYGWKRDNKNHLVVLSPMHGTAFTSYNEKPPFANALAQLARMSKFEDIRDEYIDASLQKILFQHVEVDGEGDPEMDLLLAEEFHKTLAKIAAKSKRVDAFTSLADVKVLDMNQATDENDLDFISQFEALFYNETGTAQELFEGSTAGTLVHSITKDEAFMWPLVLKVSNWLNYIINSPIGHKKQRTYNFIVSYLEVSYRNREKMMERYLLNAQYGYSKLLPQIVVGVKQRHFESLLYLENELLNLDELLVPLMSSHTMSGTQGATPTKPTGKTIPTATDGRPAAETQDKEDGTLSKESSQ